MCSFRVLVVTLVLSFTCALNIPSTRYRKYDITSSQHRRLVTNLVELYQSLSPLPDGENTYRDILDTARPHISEKSYALLRQLVKGRDNAKEILQQKYQQKMASKQKKVSISQKSYLREVLPVPRREDFWSYDTADGPISWKFFKVQKLPENYEGFPTVENIEIPFLNEKPSQRGGPFGTWNTLPVPLPVYEELPEVVNPRVQLDTMGDTIREDFFDKFQGEISNGKFVENKVGLLQFIDLVHKQIVHCGTLRSGGRGVRRI